MSKIIIDSNNLSHIINYGMGHLSNEERKTGVVFGFMKQLLTLSKRLKSNEFILCWDSQKSWRKEIYPEYKSNRKNKEKTEQEQFERQALFDQISELRRDIFPALGFNNNFIKTGYEADDLIAYTVLMNPEEEFTIVSTDQDLYQVLSDKVRIYNTITKKFIIKQDFIDKFKLDPVMYKEIKSISGCVSDNLKGINGVGETTAAKYIRQEKISIALLDKIHEGVEVIERNRKLVYLPFLKPGQRGSIPNFNIPLKKDSLELYKFKKLFNEMSFNSFLQDMGIWERTFDL